MNLLFLAQKALTGEGRSRELVSPRGSLRSRALSRASLASLRRWNIFGMWVQFSCWLIGEVWDVQLFHWPAGLFPSLTLPGTVCIPLNHGKSKYIMRLEPGAAVYWQFTSVPITKLGKAVENQAFHWNTQVVWVVHTKCSETASVCLLAGRRMHKPTPSCQYVNELRIASTGLYGWYLFS